MLRWFVTIALIAMMAFAGYQVWKANDIYEDEAEIKKTTQQYKPQYSNQSILNAQKMNPDVVGWLTVPKTKIDYLFVQSEDNDYYLHRNLKKKKAKAGTIFMDWRNPKDFSDFNTIVYGHNMKNGSMFGTLDKFASKDFFKANRYGILYLENKTYRLEIFAHLVVKSTNANIYNTTFNTVEEKRSYLKYLKKHASRYCDVGVSTDDHLITLSTCSSKTNRTVLIAKLVGE